MGWSSTSEVTMIGTLLTLDGQLFSGIFSLVTCYLSHSGIFLFAGQSLLGEGRGAARCASVSTQYTSAEVHSPISCTTSILASSWNIEQKGSNVENVGWPHSSAWTLLAPQQFRVYADCAVSAVPADCKYRKTQTFCKIISQVQIWQNYIYWVRVLFTVIIKSYRRAIWAKNGPTCFYFQAEQARWQAEHCHDLSGHYLQVQEISKKDSNFWKQNTDKQKCAGMWFLRWMFQCFCWRRLVYHKNSIK